MKNTYYPTVDFLRIFAALWVVSVHYFGETGGGNSLFKYGNLGVPLFFIISGFVISFSVQGRTLKNFFILRFLRLYPLFWFACILTFLLTLIVPHGDPVSFRDFLLNLTMLGLKGGATTLVDGSYWSLAVELAFYMLIGVFVAVFSFSNIRYFFTGWLSISFLVFFFDVQRYLLAEFTLARHAPYFIFGGFLALLMQNFSVSTLREKVIDITGMIFATLLAFYVMNYSLVSSYGVKDPKDFYYVTGFILLIFICVPFIVYYSKYVTNSRIIKLSMLCGGVTYPLYLLHQQIGKMIVHSFGAPRTFSLISILTACFMIVVSYYVYIYEKRVRKYLMIKLKVAKE